MKQGISWASDYLLILKEGSFVRQLVASDIPSVGHFVNSRRSEAYLDSKQLKQTFSHCPCRKIRTLRNSDINCSKISLSFKDAKKTFHFKKR